MKVQSAREVSKRDLSCSSRAPLIDRQGDLTGQSRGESLVDNVSARSVTRFILICLGFTSPSPPPPPSLVMIHHFGGFFHLPFLIRGRARERAKFRKGKLQETIHHTFTFRVGPYPKSSFMNRSRPRHTKYIRPNIFSGLSSLSSRHDLHRLLLVIIQLVPQSTWHTDAISRGYLEPEPVHPDRLHTGDLHCAGLDHPSLARPRST